MEKSQETAAKPERTMNLPKHNAGLALRHNAHQSDQEPIATWIAENDWFEWRSDEHKDRSLATDECWTLQWYVEPGMCYAVAAPTLDEVLLFAAMYATPAQEPR